MALALVTDSETREVCRRAHDVLARASQGYANPDDIPNLLKLCRELLLRKNHHTKLHTVARMTGAEKDVRHEHRNLVIVSDLYRRMVEYFLAVDAIATSDSYLQSHAA